MSADAVSTGQSSSLIAVCPSLIVPHCYQLMRSGVPARITECLSLDVLVKMLDEGRFVITNKTLMT
jgi:hypothetical protein